MTIIIRHFGAHLNRIPSYISSRTTTKLSLYNEYIFSKVLQIGDRQRALRFKKIPAAYLCYQVELSDEKGGRIPFTMIKAADGPWRATSPKIPLWIAQAESVIGAAIEEQLALV